MPKIEHDQEYESVTCAYCCVPHWRYYKSEAQSK